MKVFLDIHIGDVAAYDSRLAAYELTQKFFKEVGSQVHGRGKGQEDRPKGELDPKHLLTQATAWAGNAIRQRSELVMPS